MIGTFKEFINNVIVENLHPEIKDIVTNQSNNAKQTLLANKIKDLSVRGERTGIEGNMPKGSSRAYLKHDSSHKIHLDGMPASIPVGTKVAIRASLDKHHNKKNYDGMGLGALQNQAEGGDHWVNSNYRVLTEHPDKPGHFKTNLSHGIFPPLIDHDHENHEWTQVGHSRDIKSKSEFKELTRTKSHPEGISHEDFVDALQRTHDQQNGRYHEGNPQHEKNLDHVSEHPLVEKFADYHNNTGNPPSDYRSLQNIGVFHHPDGHKMIVARDHGFNTEVAHAYKQARQKKAHSENAALFGKLGMM
jgi:hypothetical protein